LGLFLVTAIYLGHLLRVRRNDAPFWGEEEESRRADWDRRVDNLSQPAKGSSNGYSEQQSGTGMPKPPL